MNRMAVESMPPLTALTKTSKMPPSPDQSPDGRKAKSKTQQDEKASLPGQMFASALSSSYSVGADRGTQDPSTSRLLAALGKRRAEDELAGLSSKRRFEQDPDAGDSLKPAASAISLRNNFSPGNWNQNLAMDNSHSQLIRFLHSTQSGVLGNDPSGLGFPASSLLLNNDQHALMRAELSAQYLQEQAARNAALLASLERHQALQSVLGSTQQGFPWASLQQREAEDSARAQYASLAGLASLPDLSSLPDRLNPAYLPPAPYPFVQGQAQSAAEQQDLMRLVSQLSGSAGQPAPASMPEFNAFAPTAAAQSSSRVERGSLEKQHLTLPPCDEDGVLPYTKRGKYPLGIDEDPNWLSEFHCFVREDLIEVFRASRDDCKSRNNSISHQQVGIRCRYCAHLTPSARVGRSSAFPSSLRQIYQSFTMMLRDHFGNCDAMPTSVQEKFLALKDKPSQGATDSKRFWIYSAMKIGMADSPSGIVINEHTISAGSKAAPFGTIPGQPWSDDSISSIPLVLPQDSALVSEFLFVLMSQVQVVRLTEAERIGNRRSLRIGLPGFGCRNCCEHRRLGLCRMFPARRRTLAGKINDLYDHIRRCTVTPQHVKDHLDRLKHQMNTDSSTERRDEQEFFDRIWSRLGYGPSGGT